MLLCAVAVIAAGVAVWPSSAHAARPPVLASAHVAYDGDLGDPYILALPGQYVAFGTGDWPARIPTATTTDLVNWVRGPDAMPTLPAWATPDPRNSLSWAPATIAVGGRYIMYVSLQQASSRRECIAATTSTSPTGPFTDALGGPLMCQLELGGSIDPSVVRDAGGLHLLWKSDGNCCRVPVSLWEQDLRPDGLAMAGTAHRLLTALQSWQGGVIENPAMVAAKGGWWLFYSGNVFDTAAYGTGVAFCPTLTGPCRDDGRYLSTAAREFSPGGLETFRDNRGATWAVFATWTRPSRNGRFYCCRALDLATLHTS